ncbi:MAG: TetR/AcrR family transcriptional regulator C-terminal domain-containing protein [Eubacterium sp.]|nr:TetR/AcrR family transcriptional regulator C-terminal domain-containing protein [Eubacterium sp.]
MNKNSPCAVKTKKKMAATLKELMKTTPFEKITVSDITQASGVHRQTFYYHFQDRYELLDWLIYYELLHPFIEGFTLDNMYERFFNLFTTMKENKRFYQTAIKINTGDIMGFISRYANEQLAITLKRVGMENSIILSSNNDNTIIAEFLGFGLSGVVISWAQRGMKETPAEMTENLRELVGASAKMFPG